MSATRAADQQTPRYKIRESTSYNGKWAVVDVRTGLPAIVDDVPLDCMTEGEAKDLVDLMNGSDLRTER
ncbi:hypothetical protein [Rhizobium grahamii]|uniref:Uncharacterized protein n=1 Tax=Rhizobium grahamii CCGE 502 TaxID=990285 RepID=S3HGI9_9HYPH|nr:hypothetical protein [Rhizobium grahamii]EPE97145.1 hypothetical protein RGCCGE502_16295 [Rhizobium grahamii CCGE 502]